MDSKEWFFFHDYDWGFMNLDAEIFRDLPIVVKAAFQDGYDLKVLFQEPENNKVLSENNYLGLLFDESISVIEENEVLSEDNYLGLLFDESISIIEKNTEPFSVFENTSADLSAFGETNVE